MSHDELIDDLGDALAAEADPGKRMALIERMQAIIHAASPVREQPVSRVHWVPVDMVEPNDYNPNSVARREMRLLYLSILQDGYCVEESTPILRADLRWVPAGSLREGDRLIAFDEDSGKGKGAQRCYRTTAVTGNYVEEADVVRVRTDRGELTVTPDHPFLARRCYGKGFHGPSWIAAADLRPGDAVIHLMRPWQEDRTWEAGWLSGFLDGEGTLANNQNNGHRPAVRLSGYQRPGETADRMIREMSARATVKVFRVNREDQPKWNDMVMARVDRMTEIMRLLGTVRPERLIQNGEFWEGARIVSPAEKGASTALVEAVTPAGRANIARLGTGTRTYIADGFAVHNTQPVVTIWDPEKGRYVIVDGFHRYFTCKNNPDIRERNHGLLPIVVLDKPINDRMASTVRHNRARGKHSVDGMANMVFQMLDNGWADADICNELGMEPEELLRLKHITGFSKLFKDAEYTKEWESRRQIKLRIDYEKEHGKGSVVTAPARTPKAEAAAHPVRTDYQPPAARKRVRHPKG